MRRALACLAAALALLTTAIGAAATLAAWRAGYWLEGPAQTPRRADAIAVLGGDEDGERAARALALYHEGYAPVIVLTGLQMSEGAVPAALNWRTEQLEARGVPRSALRFELDARNSHTEAVRLLAMMRREGWRTLVVVSDPPHMRRLSWMWSRIFEGSGLDFVLVASQPGWWKPDGWWRDERSGQFVLQELVKLAYHGAKR